MLLLVLPYLQLYRGRESKLSALGTTFNMELAPMGKAWKLQVPARLGLQHSAQPSANQPHSSPVQRVGGGRHLRRRQLQLLAQPFHHAAAACRAVGGSAVRKWVPQSVARKAEHKEIQRASGSATPAAAGAAAAALSTPALLAPCTALPSPCPSQSRTRVQAEVVKGFPEVGDVARHPQPGRGRRGGAA